MRCTRFQCRSAAGRWERGRFFVLDLADELCVDLGLAAGVGAAISSGFVDSHMGLNIGGYLNQLVAETPQSQMGKKGVVDTGLSTEEEPHGAVVLSSRGSEWTEMTEENRRFFAELAKLKEQGSHMGRGRSTLRSRLNRSKSKPDSILLLIFHSICLPSSS